MHRILFALLAACVMPRATAQVPMADAARSATATRAVADTTRPSADNPGVVVDNRAEGGRAQTSAVPAAAAMPAAPVTATAVVCCLLASGTAVQLEILDLLNSSARTRGDRFGLRVITDVRVNGLVAIPAGTLGVGEVVHAAAARGGGAPGELLIAARTLDVAGQTVRLRGLRLGATGVDATGTALGVSLAVGVFAMFIRGHEIEIPALTRVEAKLTDSLTLALPAPVPLSSNTQPE